MSFYVFRFLISAMFCSFQGQPGIKQLGTAPMPQGLLKLFKLASPKPTHPTSTISFETSVEAFAHSFPFVSLPPGCPCPHGVAMLPSLGIRGHDKLSFQWQSLPDPLASPYLKYNKTRIIFILKHSSTMLNRSNKSRHLCLGPDHGEVLSLSSFQSMWVFHICPYHVGKNPLLV